MRLLVSVCVYTNTYIVYAIKSIRFVASQCVHYVCVVCTVSVWREYVFMFNYAMCNMSWTDFDTNWPTPNTILSTATNERNMWREIRENKKYRTQWKIVFRRERKCGIRSKWKRESGIWKNEMPHTTTRERERKRMCFHSCRLQSGGVQ